MTSSEALNLQIWSARPDPVLVHLNGMMLTAAGLAILRFHWLWRPVWTANLTITGALMTLGGVFRLFWPNAPQADEGPATDAFIAVLATLGLIMSLGALAPLLRGEKD